MGDVATRPGRLGRIGRAISGRPKVWAALGLVMVAAGFGAWWALQLWGLPDVGEPFDVKAFESFDVPPERNAFVEYREAARLLKGIRYNAKGVASINAAEWKNYTGDWSKASPAWRDYEARASPTLDVFRRGSEKPGALYEHSEGLTMRTLLPVSQDLREMARLAVLEGGRLQHEGDLAGAWGWYRATLRASRHSGHHGFQIERLIGAAMHDEAYKAIVRWADDPRVDAPLLRRALGEVIAIDALTVPRSETVKLEHLLFIHSMHDPYQVEDLLVMKDPNEPPDWCQGLPISDAQKKPIQEARVLLANDRERSVRVARLMTANWLAQVDKPPSRRAKLARQDPPIYEAGPDDPPASKALPPEELSSWLDSSLLALRFYRGLGRYTNGLERERVRQARLVVHLAGEIYRREHGQPPPSPRDLVGPYLESLPEGFDAPYEETPKPGGK